MYNELCTPTHPGEIIKDNLSVLGLTQKRLAEIINVQGRYAERYSEWKTSAVGRMSHCVLRRDGHGRRNIGLICRVGIIIYATRNDKKINDFLQNIRKMCAAL